MVSCVLKVLSEAHHYGESARKILAENDRLTRELRSITGTEKKLLRVGTSRYRASYIASETSACLPQVISRRKD